MTSSDKARDQPQDSEILAARHEVELARTEVEVRLRDVGRSGRRIWTRLGERARPFLIGGAVVVSALILMQAVRSVSRTRRSGNFSPPGRPSLLRMAVGAALGIVMRSATTALVRRAVEAREPADRTNGLGPGTF
ncbi:MAG TPA: hypothetical protein VMS65_07765 [Polyangiaceae bacterium]|nr:hypothetical protein [Polyangiaceae bacterium]